jgi:hypothetical protein
MENTKMAFKEFIITSSFLLILLSACSYGTGTPGDVPDPVPCGEEVEWDLAVKILNQGEVEQVVQFHSLEVTLILADGCELKTVEPRIDDIFHEVENCGSPCEGIIVATE